MKQIKYLKRLQKEVISTYNYSDILEREKLRNKVKTKLGNDIIFLGNDDIYNEKNLKFFQQLSNCSGLQSNPTNVEIQQPEELERLSCIIDDRYYLVLFENKRNEFIEQALIDKSHFHKRIAVDDGRGKRFLVYIYYPHTTSFIRKDLVCKYRETYLLNLTIANRKVKIRKALARE